MNKGMKQAVIYTRVSTTGQALEGVSLDAQMARARAYCGAMGFEIIGEYTDAGLSGKRADNRPGLQSALDHACNGRAALSHRRATGHKISRYTEYGFDVDIEGRLTENQNEQTAIKMMLDMRRMGATLRDIADKLNDSGITTKTGAGQWQAMTVKKVLDRYSEPASKAKAA